MPALISPRAPTTLGAPGMLGNGIAACQESKLAGSTPASTASSQPFAMGGEEEANEVSSPHSRSLSLARSSAADKSRKLVIRVQPL